MVVNKNNIRSLGLDEEALAQEVTLTFRADVSGIERLRRDTGEIEALAPKDHQIMFSLPAGTGDLFKYSNDRPFAGVNSGGNTPKAAGMPQ
jgi:hypothetical protein